MNKKLVSQSELYEFLRKQGKLIKLKKEREELTKVIDGKIKTAEKNFKSVSAALIEKLVNKAKVEPGTRTVQLVETPPKASPKWKQIWEALMFELGRDAKLAEEQHKEDSKKGKNPKREVIVS